MTFAINTESHYLCTARPIFAFIGGGLRCGCLSRACAFAYAFECAFECAFAYAFDHALFMRRFRSRTRERVAGAAQIASRRG